MNSEKIRRRRCVPVVAACFSIGAAVVMAGCSPKPAEDSAAAPAAPAAPAAAPANVPPGAAAPRPAPNQDAAANAAAFRAAREKAEGR